MNFKQLSFYFFILGIFAGCQTVPYQGQARDVKRRPLEGGTIAIPINYRDEDRVAAENKMRSACGTSPFKITEEGESVIGTKSVKNGRSVKRDDTRRSEGKIFGIDLVSGQAGGQDTTSETSTQQVKEWRIEYACETTVKKASR